MAMSSLGDILKSKHNDSPLKRGITAASIVEVTNAVLAELWGPGIRDHASAAYIRNKTLAIACLSSAVAQEIRFKEQQIIAQVSARAPYAVIERIRYLL